MWRGKREEHMHFNTSEDTAFHTCSTQQMQLCMASFNTLLRGRGGMGLLTWQNCLRMKSRHEVAYCVFIISLLVFFSWHCKNSNYQLYVCSQKPVSIASSVSLLLFSLLKISFLDNWIHRGCFYGSQQKNNYIHTVKTCEHCQLVACICHI